MSVRRGHPAYRVFIFGHEVTADCLNVTLNWADDIRAPSTAQFKLSNQAAGAGGSVSRYVIEPEDIFALNPSLDPVTLELGDVLSKLANDPDLVAYWIALENGRTEGERLAYLKANITGFNDITAANTLARGNSVLLPLLAERITPLVTTYNDQIRQRLDSIRDDTKRRVVAAKFDKTAFINQPYGNISPTLSIAPERLKYLIGQAPRFPFVVNRPIFHTSDPVRIFFRDPFTPSKWYYGFSGFITDSTVHRGINNECTLTFTCEDVLRIFRYSRITTNPGIFDVAAIEQQEDAVLQTFFGNDFTNLTLSEFLYFLIWGPARTELSDLLLSLGNLSPQAVQSIQARLATGERLQHTRYSPDGEETNSEVPLYGVGAFNFERSMTVIFGPAEDEMTDTDKVQKLRSAALTAREVHLDSADALGVYQAAVDHEVRVSDLEKQALTPDLAIPRGNLIKDYRTGQPLISEVITAIGTNPHIYPVDNGRLIILAPSTLGPNTNREIIDKGFKGVSGKTTWKNRLFMIYDFCESIEFKFYATPKGDLVVEMPLYDFEPRDFGEDAIDESTLTRALQGTTALSAARTARTSSEQQLFDTLASSAIGPLAPHYRIARRDTLTSSQTFTDAKVITQLVQKYQVAQAWSDLGFVQDVAGVRPVVETLRALVPQFGVRDQEGNARVYVASEEGARAFAQLQMNQHNSDALTEQIDTIMQLRIGPNRPVFIEDEHCIATVRSVSRTIDWESRSVSQTIGLNYLRTWDGSLGSDGKPVYTTLGGAASRPLNYAAFFNRARLTASSAPRAKKGG